GPVALRRYPSEITIRKIFILSEVVFSAIRLILLSYILSEKIILPC
ncbi:MAG: hypothetical protein ACI9OS_002265, partial [Ulvibacter sp.]